MPTRTDTPAAQRRQARAALAFNEGSDARLAGLPLESCPYPEDSRLAPAWRHGWRDVEESWCTDSVRNYKDLPPIRAEAVGRHAAG